MKKAVFLDRDGTLIVDKIYLNDPNQIEYLPQVFAALRLLRDQGFVFIGCTNQSGIARGIVSYENLMAIHQKIRAEFSRNGIDFLEFYYAPYMTDFAHPTRKPNPGMILRGAFDYGIDPRQSWMVGDRMVDVEAGHRAGCRSALLGNLEDPKQSTFQKPELHVSSLFEAAQKISEWK